MVETWQWDGERVVHQPSGLMEYGAVSAVEAYIGLPEGGRLVYSRAYWAGG